MHQWSLAMLVINNVTSIDLSWQLDRKVVTTSGFLLASWLCRDVIAVDCMPELCVMVKGGPPPQLPVVVEDQNDKKEEQKTPTASRRALLSNPLQI
jgi:hypothetical protein